MGHCPLGAMDKISEFRRHAEECRALAERADSTGHRHILLNMASMWDSLAEGRKRTRARQANSEPDEGVQGSPVDGV